jgi:hypothetical protein
MADIVKFNLPDGTEVSNDPRFYQQDLQRQIDEQAQALLAVREPKGKEAPSDTEQTDENVAGAGQEESQYASDSAKELKAEAERRGLEVSGLTRKSQFIALLEADDAQSEDDEESDEEE